MDKAYSLFKDEDYLQMGLIEDKKKKIEKKINENMGGVLKYSEKNNSLVLKKNGEEILIFNVSMGIESFILFLISSVLISSASIIIAIEKKGKIKNDEKTNS